MPFTRLQWPAYGNKQGCRDDRCADHRVEYLPMLDPLVYQEEFIPGKEEEYKTDAGQIKAL